MGDWIYLHVLQRCKFLYLVTKLLFSDQFNEKRLAISLPLIMELWCIQLLVITEIVDDVELCCLQLWSYNVSYYYSIDDFWWSWTVFHPITEDTVITCFLRQDFQWVWTMYGFKHIICVIFDNEFIGFLLCILYFFCTCIFVLYFLLTEAWYESTDIHEHIDELYI